MVAHEWYPEGGLFSVALSLRSPSPVINRHRSSVEPGLSSPLQNKAATVQPSGGGTLRREWQQVKALYGCFARKTLAWRVWVGTLQG